MGSINEREGRFRAVIRKKGVNICATFSNLETAEIWVKFKEDIIDEMNAFEVKESDLITFEDALHMKIDKMKEEKLSERHIGDVVLLFGLDNEFIKTAVNKITAEMVKEEFERQLKTPIFFGGSRDGKTGIKKLPALKTLLRKFVSLSGIFEYLIQNGCQIVNPARSTVSRIRILINKKEKSKETE